MQDVSQTCQNAPTSTTTTECSTTKPRPINQHTFPPHPLFHAAVVLHRCLGVLDIQLMYTVIVGGDIQDDTSGLK